MFKRTKLYQAVAAALFLAAGASAPALAADDIELVGTRGLNDTPNSAQAVTIGTDGKVVINGALGITSVRDANAIPDVDFYSFEGKFGDSVTIDIDNGIKSRLPDGTFETRPVDTILGLFKRGALPNTWELMLMVNDVAVSDEGSQPRAGGGLRDARIGDPTITTDPKINLPADGTYVVGVSSVPRFFNRDGTMMNETVTNPAAPFPNGSYTLIISGVTPPVLVQYMNIDIKPGGEEEASINPKAKGNIPVALLSKPATRTEPAFKPLDVKRDRDSLTFGRTGEEKSFLRCNKEAVDLNDDGIPDLICHFDNELANWEHVSTVGLVKGTKVDGWRFEGSGRLKVVPAVSKN